MVESPVALPGLNLPAPGAGFDIVSISLALAPVIAFIVLIYWGLQKRQRKEQVIELSYYLIILELVLIALLPVCNQLLPCFGWAFMPIMMFGILMGFIGHRRRKEKEHKAHVSKAVAEGFIMQMPQVQTLHGPGLSSMNAPSRPTHPIGMLIYYFNKPKHILSDMAESKEKKPEEKKPKDEPIVFQKKTESWKTRLERMGKSSEGDSKAVPDEKKEEKPKAEGKRLLIGDAPEIAKESTRKADEGKKLPQKKLFESWGLSRGSSKGAIAAAAQPQRQQSKPNYVERKIIETINRESSASNRVSSTQKMAKRAPAAEPFSGKRFERRFENPIEKPAENAPQQDISWEAKFDKWKQKRARTDSEDGESKGTLREIQKQNAEAEESDHKKIHGIIEDVLNRRKLAEGKEEEKT